MTPEEALLLAKTVVDLYAKASTDLLEVIARALARGLPEPVWARRGLDQVLPLRHHAQAIVGRLQAAGPSEVSRILEEIYTRTATSGLQAVNPRAVAALAADTNRMLTSLGPPLLRWTEDVHRSVIAEVAASGVVGTASRRDVAAQAMNRFATLGVGGFTDSAGKRWQLDTYAEMATRSAIGRAHLAGTLARFQAQGRQWVMVSNSPEECGLCRPWEGKVLSLTHDLAPPAVPGLRYGGTLAAAVAAGLHHPNCTHRLTAYIPGLTRPLEFSLPGRRTENPQGYEDRQRQRALERRVRESKRRVTAVKAFGATPALTHERNLLKRRQVLLADFVNDHDRKAWVSKQRSSIPGGPLIPDEPAYDEPRRVIGLAQQVHRLPDRLPTLAVRFVDQPSEPGLGAVYRFAGPAPHTPASRYPVSMSIDINSGSARPVGLPTVHELGHFLDHRGLGSDRARFASVVDGDYASLMQAIENSQARRRLTDLKNEPDADLTHLSYLTDPRELFARAYSQWIATESADEQLLEQVSQLTHPVPYQWDDEDFTPIRDAFRIVFKKAGLLLVRRTSD